MIHLKSALIGAGISGLALISFTGFAQQSDTKPAAKADLERKMVAAGDGGHIIVTGEGLKIVKNPDGSITITGKNIKAGQAETAEGLPLAGMMFRTSPSAAHGLTVEQAKGLSLPAEGLALDRAMLRHSDLVPAQGMATMPAWTTQSAFAPAPPMMGMAAGGGSTTMTANGKYLYICQGTKVYRLDAMTLAVLATTDLVHPKSKPAK